MSRLAPKTLCVVAVVVLSTILVASAPGAAQSTQTVAGTQLAPDDVSLRIDIHENRSAVWTVEYRVRLDDENSTAAFDSVREDVDGNESRYTAEFRNRMDATAQTAANATGRDMEVRNVSVSVSRKQLPQEYGVVTYRFVWTNFAAEDGDEMRAGDALEGLFLDEQTSLLVTWPEGYDAQDATPEPDDRRNRTIVWNGPLDFGEGEPRVTLSPRNDAVMGPDGSDDSNVWFVGAGLLFVVAVGGGWMFYRRRGGTPRGPSPGDDGRGGSGATEATEARRTENDAPEAGATEAGTDDAPASPDAGEARPADASAAAGAAEAADEPATRPEADETPSWEDELLSNEERVLALIDHEGGRLKQQEVAQTLDWTDAKTSQVVREMRDENELDAFRLGRENVLVLPEENDEEDIV